MMKNKDQIKESEDKMKWKIYEIKWEREGNMTNFFICKWESEKNKLKGQNYVYRVVGKNKKLKEVFINSSG